MQWVYRLGLGGPSPARERSRWSAPSGANIYQTGALHRERSRWYIWSLSTFGPTLYIYKRQGWESNQGLPFRSPTANQLYRISVWFNCVKKY